MSQLTRKPLPVTPPAWTREVAGILRFLEKSDSHLPDEGDKWFRKMRRYYSERLTDLFNSVPRGFKSHSDYKNLRLRFIKCRHFYTQAVK